MNEQTERRTISMYPTHWETVDLFARDNFYGNTSLAVRRIIDEWVQFKGSQRPLPLETTLNSQ